MNPHLIEAAYAQIALLTGAGAGGRRIPVSLALAGTVLCAGCGLNEPIQRITARPTQSVYLIDAGMSRLDGEVVIWNGLSDAVTVHPGCAEDFEGLDKLVAGVWTGVQESVKLGGPLCPPMTLASGDSVRARFIVGLHITSNGEWPASSSDIPGLYRARFGAGRTIGSGRGHAIRSETFELRLLPDGN